MAQLLALYLGACHRMAKKSQIVLCEKKPCEFVIAVPSDETGSYSMLNKILNRAY